MRTKTLDLQKYPEQDQQEEAKRGREIFQMIKRRTAKRNGGPQGISSKTKPTNKNTANTHKGQDQKRGKAEVFCRFCLSSFSLLYVQQT
jgi:hypothetical protein